MTLFLTTKVFSQDVNKICENYVLKIGGAQNVGKIENISVEQLGYSNNYEIPQNRIVVKNKAIYQETIYPDAKLIVALEGNKGWELNPFVSKKARELSTTEVGIYKANIDIFGPLYDYYTNGSNSKVKEILIDSEKEVDRDICFKLKVTYKANFIDYIFISKKTYLVRKVENSMGTIIYSNYKKVNNVLFPFNLEIKNNLGIMTIDVTKLKANIKIDSKIFIFPSK